jgi:hypothetical protein
MLFLFPFSTSHVEKVILDSITLVQEIGVFSALKGSWGVLERDRWEGERKRGEVEKKRGDVKRKRGDVERKRGDVKRKRGDVEKTTGDVEKKRWDVERKKNSHLNEINFQTNISFHSLPQLSSP